MPEVLDEDLMKMKGDAIGDTLYSERWVLKTLMKLVQVKYSTVTCNIFIFPVWVITVYFSSLKAIGTKSLKQSFALCGI